VKALEVGLVICFTLGGIRSIVFWAARPFESDDVGDQLLYAAFRAARIGSWFAFAGLFLIYATSDEVDLAAQTQRFSWYLGIVLFLAATQFVTGWILGRRTPGGPAV
jgi:hypothetical protein